MKALASFARRCARFRPVDQILFWTTFLSYAYFYQGGGQNEAARFDAIRAFIEDHSLMIDRFVYNSADIIQLNGHAYSSKAPGTFYLGLIPYAVVRWVLNHLGVDPVYSEHWACYVATLVAVSLPTALIPVLVYRLALRKKATQADAVAVALTIGLATICFPFGTVFFSHAVSAFFLFFAFYQIVAYRQDDPRPWRLWTSGLSMGFAITMEYPSAIGVFWIGLFALWTLRTSWKLALRPVVAGVLGLIPLFIYNIVAFHNPFYVTYEAYAQTTTQFAAHQQGVLGIRIPLWDPSAWPQFLSNLAEITYRPLRGLFFHNPVLLVAMAGLVGFIARMRRAFAPEELVAALIFFSYLAMNAGFGDSVVYWGGGASFGPRHVIVTLPFLSLFILRALRVNWLRTAFVPLALISAFYCLMGTAVEPRTPYSPPNPLFYFYLPRFMTGMLGMNTLGIFSNDFMTANSVSFNWGRLVGFALPYQLLPLYVLWIHMAQRLDRHLKIASRGFTYAIGILVLIAAMIPILSLFQ